MMCIRGQRAILPVVLCVSMLAGCDGGKGKAGEGALPPVGKKAMEDAARIAKKKIYFGHMSVGANILDGLRDILTQIPGTSLNIVETKDPSDFDSPVFGHSPIGKNGDPASKIKDFVGLIDGGLGRKVDIAFFKLCYIDILSDTDADEVFRRYNTAMRSLRGRYPKVAFIHMTVPLRTVQIGFKAAIKQLIDRPVGGYADNCTRSRYNELLRQEYKGKEPLFDLAEIESTFPDGRRALFESSGKTCEALVPDYTNDGGHLNEHGQRVVAAQLLAFLAALPD